MQINMTKKEAREKLEKLNTFDTISTLEALGFKFKEEEKWVRLNDRMKTIVYVNINEICSTLNEYGYDVVKR